MIFNITILLLFLIKLITCDILDEPIDFYSINEGHILRKHHEEQISKDLISFVPLHNPQILGSFSKNMFIIGSSYMNGTQSNQSGKDVNPIYFISEPNTFQHSIDIIGDNISIFALTSKPTNKQDYVLQSNVIYTMKLNSVSNKAVVDLKDCEKRVFVNNIKVDKNIINSFASSLDHVNRFYCSIVKEYGTDKMFITQFNYDNNEFKSFYLNETLLDFKIGSIQLGTYHNYGIIFGNTYNSNDGKLITYNINIDSTLNHRIKTQLHDKYIKIIYNDPRELYLYSYIYENIIKCYIGADSYCLKQHYTYNDNTDTIYLIKDYQYDNKIPMDMAQFLLKLLIPICTVSIIVGILVLVYFFVYKKRKQHQTNNYFNHQTKDEKIEIETIGADIEEKYLTNNN